MNMKKILALVLALAMVFAFAACQKKDTPANTNSQGAQSNTDQQSGEDTVSNLPNPLKLGLDASFPPMGFQDEQGNIVGFDIDLAQAVCDYYGIELQCVPIDWNSKDVELEAGNIDCIWNGLSINDDRLAAYNMSRPYLANRQVIVTTPESGIATLADLAGKTIALQSDSTAAEAVAANPEMDQSLGGKVELLDNLTALMELQSGNVDAVAMDEVVADYVISNQSDGVRGDLVILEESLAPEEYGIGFRKDETGAALCAAVETALDDLKAQGKLAEISIKWFGEDKITF